MLFWPGSEDRGDQALGVRGQCPSRENHAHGALEVGRSEVSSRVREEASVATAGGTVVDTGHGQIRWVLPSPSHCPSLGAKLGAPHVSVGGRVGAQRASRGRRGRAGAPRARGRLCPQSPSPEQAAHGGRTGSPSQATSGAWSEPSLASGLTPGGGVPIFASPRASPPSPGALACAWGPAECVWGACGTAASPDPSPLAPGWGGPGVGGVSSCLKQAAEDKR